MKISRECFDNNLPFHLPVKMLGQSGCVLFFPDVTVYVDPYLSNSVQELDSSDLIRQVPIPIQPHLVDNADWVLITHDHIDHCDPSTLPTLAQASPQAKFIGPPSVLKNLFNWGISSDRLFDAQEVWIELSKSLQLHAIPAAHPEVNRDELGRLECVGYILKYEDKKIYFAGDTFVRKEIIDAIKVHGDIHTAFLPINEHNFFLGNRGILGNMSPREAFKFAEEIGASNVVVVHWDMFSVNSVPQEEIRLLYKNLNPPFALHINPRNLNFNKVMVSFVIRTLNESRYLQRLLEKIYEQIAPSLPYEIILVDSGSTDRTLEIAEDYGCHIHRIAREDFSFGRSLNLGCSAARGEIIVIVSGHCIPVDQLWLQKLCMPIFNATVDYTYGGQIPGDDSFWSEGRIFSKYFGEKSFIPQKDFFCNNANAAISRRAWEIFHFDEELTGLEDMAMAQQLQKNGMRIAYVADAKVFHLHNESWTQVRRRFEREAIALRKIMPQIHISKIDVVRYIITSIWLDWLSTLREGVWLKHALNIVRYRCCQYFGAYQGNKIHKKLSALDKEKYFFPN